MSEGGGSSRRRRLRARWYNQYRPAWREVRPIALGAALVGVLVLGTVGFQAYAHDHHIKGNLIDSAYRSITLFELDGYHVHPPLPWTLELARWLAPALIGYAIFRGVAAVFRGQLQLAGIRLLARDHVVVAGLGDAGFRLALAFRKEGFRVVVVEADEGNRSIAGCRDRGIAVLVGDATDARMLARARVDRARYLVVVCGDNGRNVEVQVAAAHLVRSRERGTLHAFVHLDDPGLWRLLKSEAMAGRGDRGLRLEFFNVPELAARALLDAHPPFDADAPGTRPHVLIAGGGTLADALVLNVARLWQNRDAPPAELRVSVLAEDAPAAIARLTARHPELEHVCDLRAVATPLGAALQRAPLDLDAEPPTAAFVAVLPEAAALETGFALRARSELASTAIAVAVADAGAGMATLLASGAVHGFGILDGALDAGALVAGDTEVIARAKHEEYLRHAAERGEEMGRGVLVGWSELPEDVRDANRAFADGIGHKLAAAGCALVPAPLLDPAGPLFSFSEEEVEELARLEHDRWVEDKLRQGWRAGDVRDDAGRVHDQLVPWEQLSDEERDKDRDPVRELPVMLAHAGYEIVRPVPAAAAPAAIA